MQKNSGPSRLSSSLWSPVKYNHHNNNNKSLSSEKFKKEGSISESVHKFGVGLVWLVGINSIWVSHDADKYYLETNINDDETNKYEYELNGFMYTAKPSRVFCIHYIINKFIFC